jgi:hypothetical protein
VLFFSSLFIYNLIFSDSSSSITPLESNIELLGFQTVSAASIFENSDVSDLSYTQLAQTTQLNNDSNDLDISDYIDSINPYIKLFETILNSDNLISYVQSESDLEGYDYLITYKTNTLDKNELVYKIYYNQFDQNNEGIIKSQDKSYYFNQTTDAITVNYDEKSFIVISISEIESAQRFDYSLYKNNQIVSSNSIEIIRVKRNIEARLTINQNNLIMRLYGMRNLKSNLDELEIEYEINDKQNQTNGRIKVNLQFNQNEGKYHYVMTLPNNKKVDVPRPNMGPDHNPATTRPGRVPR